MIDGTGYRTDYEPCQALNMLGSQLVEASYGHLLWWEHRQLQPFPRAMPHSSQIGPVHFSGQGRCLFL